MYHFSFMPFSRRLPKLFTFSVTENHLLVIQKKQTAKSPPPSLYPYIEKLGQKHEIATLYPKHSIVFKKHLDVLNQTPKRLIWARPYLKPYS